MKNTDFNYGEYAVVNDIDLDEAEALMPFLPQEMLRKAINELGDNPADIMLNKVKADVYLTMHQAVQAAKKSGRPYTRMVDRYETDNFEAYIQYDSPNVEAKFKPKGADNLSEVRALIPVGRQWPYTKDDLTLPTTADCSINTWGTSNKFTQPESLDNWIAAQQAAVDFIRGDLTAKYERAMAAMTTEEDCMEIRWEYVRIVDQRNEAALVAKEAKMAKTSPPFKAADFKRMVKELRATDGRGEIVKRFINANDHEWQLQLVKLEGSVVCTLAQLYDGKLREYDPYTRDTQRSIIEHLTNERPLFEIKEVCTDETN